MAYSLTLTGNTYGIKEVLKSLGFKWNPMTKGWKAMFDNKSKAEEMARRWSNEGVYGNVDQEVEKRYRVKESWIFNLESMDDKLWVIAEDVREGKIQLPITIAGTVCNSEDDVWAIRDEADELRSKAWSSRGVTGKEYGRIKALVAWRVDVRYATCIASGMNETDAGRCFEDM